MPSYTPRWRCLTCCVSREVDLCVCDIANIVGTTQSAISHQLRLLKQSKLVKFRREGKTIFYSLDDEHIEQIVKKGSEHIEEL